MVIPVQVLREWLYKKSVIQVTFSDGRSKEIFHLNPIRLKQEKKGAKGWREVCVKVNNCFNADKRGLKLRKGYKQSAKETVLPVV